LAGWPSREARPIPSPAVLTLRSASTYMRSAVSNGSPLRLFQASLAEGRGGRSGGQLDRADGVARVASGQSGERGSPFRAAEDVEQARAASGDVAFGGCDRTSGLAVLSLGDVLVAGLRQRTLLVNTAMRRPPGRAVVSSGPAAADPSASGKQTGAYLYRSNLSS